MANMFINAMTDLWNSAGTTYSAIKMNVTNSASSATSKLLQLQVGGVDMFYVDKTGNMYVGGTIQGTGTNNPSANDSAGLGQSGTAWSDLFLASGGVINWNAADVTITHSSNTLTFGGASSGYAFTGGPVVPATDDASALGTTLLGWSDAFFATGGTIHFANTNWVATHTSGILTVGTGDLRITTAGTNAASVVTVGGTQTLTGKTLTAPTITAPLISAWVGMVVDFAGTTAPTGWLLCYGQAISRTTYSVLFSAISTTYGTGDGSTTFNLPDLRGRVVAGQDDMGGSSANRLTGVSGSVDGDTLGAAGGAETHTLALTEIPAHDHGAVTGGRSANHSHTFSANTGNVSADHTHAYSGTTNSGGSSVEARLFDAEAVTGTAAASSAGAAETITSVAHDHTFSGTTGGISANHYHAVSGTTSGESVDHNHAITSAGGGGAHMNVQPTIILNKIIYAGV
jgi:microcystin-dependent protein